MADAPANEAVLVRHAATEWSVDGRHTGRTDLPLTDAGREAARALSDRLAGCRFDLVLCSPARRAREACAHLRQHLVILIQRRALTLDGEGNSHRSSPSSWWTG